MSVPDPAAPAQEQVLLVPGLPITFCLWRIAPMCVSATFLAEWLWWYAAMIWDALCFSRTDGFFIVVVQHVAMKAFLHWKTVQTKRPSRMRAGALPLTALEQVQYSHAWQMQSCWPLCFDTHDSWELKILTCMQTGFEQSMWRWSSVMRLLGILCARCRMRSGRSCTIATDLSSGIALLCKLKTQPVSDWESVCFMHYCGDFSNISPACCVDAEPRIWIWRPFFQVVIPSAISWQNPTLSSSQQRIIVCSLGPYGIKCEWVCLSITVFNLQVF